MSGTVSRNKYDNIKSKAEKWRNKAMETINDVEDMQLKLDEHVSNIEKLRIDNDDMTKNLRNIQFQHERIICRKEAEVDRLNMNLADYKERYKEVRDDNKDLRKSGRV